MIPFTTPFALIARDDTSVEILSGPVIDVDLLRDIPLTDSAGTPQEVLALVPYAQVRERGYACHDDETPLQCLIVTERTRVAREELLAELPQEPAPLHNVAFTIDDATYAETVSTVIRDEIGRGEGANFVIRRDVTGVTQGEDLSVALSWFRALLENERGAYWTFLVSTPGLVAVGATPEAHVTVSNGDVTMNPISGTMRQPRNREVDKALEDFLSSTKETEELFMVVDEELKMMAAICEDGGQITGPHLKEMSHVIHTEYVLRGKTNRDPRDILRETMFAPTVTGSPMQNACEVITKYEHTPRGYYSGVLALFSPTRERWSAMTHDLDAPILIRTAYLSEGTVRIPVGATLVRHSDPAGEVAETHGKAAGLLAAIGATETSARDDDAPAQPAPGRAQHIARMLQERNQRLAPFWLNTQIMQPAGPFTGKHALIIDAEDRFTSMLAHQLKHLGFTVDVTPWNAPIDPVAPDLVVAGPGPGDPQDHDNPRVAKLRDIIAERIGARRPLLAVCLSHQILSNTLGLTLKALPEPNQGVQHRINLFGDEATIGFYNTFSAWVRPGLTSFMSEGTRIEVSADPNTGSVYGLRGPGFASVQGHLESILSVDGIDALERLVGHALASAY